MLPTLERLVLDFVQAEGIELKQIIHALRVAVTGKAVWFGLYESLAILGRKSCLARIERALKWRAGGVSPRVKHQRLQVWRRGA